jgi:isoleucyl-tRNA synthetase
MIPGVAEGSVHLALFPERDGVDQAVLARWDDLLEVRARATKALEEAREAKELAASLEARVRLTGPAAVLGPLRAHEEASTVFPGNLANLLIVSAVQLTEGDGPLRVIVERAPGAKCARCWTFSQKVGTLDPPEVCERCAEVLART